MALVLAKDFKELLKSLSSNGVEFLLIGGYAVGVHGFVRATKDIDIWVKMSSENAVQIDRSLRQFGFSSSALSPDLFLTPGSIVRMGVPPLRIEILTSISGVEFDVCYAEKDFVEVDDMLVPVISLARLRQNKAASGRLKDLADLESLPNA